MNEVYYYDIVERLKQFASYEFQKEIWLSNDPSISYGFVDNYEALFEATGLEYALENSNEVFGLIADQALRDLDETTNLVDHNNWTEEEIVESNAMKIVRQKAAAALKLVLASEAEGKTVIYLKHPPESP